ncbi:MAG TPA: hypothetical protein VGF63_13060 [Solirubrobacteraceae bacterium]
MSSFVDECRREWKRLRVPAPIANEMAADLEADLAEAQTEGASAEQVLGSGAFDPRSFAASWAAERGVIHAPAPVAKSHRSLRSLVPVAVACVAAVVIVASAVALLAGGRSAMTSVAVASPIDPRHAPPAAARVFPTQIDGGGYHHALGFAVLLAAMVAVLVLAILYWSPWTDPGRRSRRHAFADDGPDGLHRY